MCRCEISVIISVVSIWSEETRQHGIEKNQTEKDIRQSQEG